MDTDTVSCLIDISKQLSGLIIELKNQKPIYDLSPEGIKILEGYEWKKKELRQTFLTAIDEVEKEIDPDADYSKKGEGDGKTKSDHVKYIVMYINQFLRRMAIDFDDSVIRKNTYPILVDSSAKLVKCHYLFQMLGIDTLFVTDRGRLAGQFSLVNFLNMKYGKKKKA